MSESTHLSAEARRLPAPMNALAPRPPVPAIRNDESWAPHGVTHPAYGTYVPQSRPEAFDLAMKA
ncbi:MAG: hypothetical protein WAX12_07290 [Candidatus Microthrix subdominans]|jgi:hypothetical protein|uniref:Uncharacterized protein n=1 Tax=Candidatus Neomicrothrix subdominans TaxID=2954438 RepID=A0A936NEY2_9ACTN|nr:hypothetical protein [Candidatus Microthrix sp.]MBK9297649.1 hypothetical protein [Candidatus Microthrix subdominans]MBK6312467.1 hypothetical protein [Candidatus Microthrix sp.]MBK6437514.1 hypothetical protein [Candidatus Microthrix sp.]MBK6969940.1 hypothetical protein [Candidatus Microthrix sp.]MBK7165976.1 hypothetical protein [Candidatus Microthrix sp.]